MRLVLVLFFFFLIGDISGQDYGTLKNKIKSTLEQMDLPYRDMDCSFRIRFNNVVRKNQFYLQSGVLDSRIISIFDSLIQDLNLKKEPNFSLMGIIRFDSYTKAVFVDLKSSDIDDIFHAAYIYPLPRHGVKAFRNEWIHYLDSIYKIGQLNDVDRYKNRIFSVEIVKDGSLSESRDEPRDSILFNFIKKQQKWKPGIQSGPAIDLLLELKIPNELFLDFDERVFNNREDLVTMHSVVRRRDLKRIVCYDIKMPSVDKSRFNIISMVNENGKLVCPVVHSGELPDTNIFVKEMSEVTSPWYTDDDFYKQFRRIYLYTRK